jgi:arylsulfatase A-like enzyme
MFVGILVILLALLLPLVRFAPPAAPARPDIVVILTDDMRSSDWVALPMTAALVGGAVFPEFIYPTPMCAPSRATLLTGQYAHNHGVLENSGPTGGWSAFRAHEGHTIATALDAAGYHTALVGKYLNGYTRQDPTPPGWDDWGQLIAAPRDVHGEYVTDIVRDRALAAIAHAGSEPLFLIAAFGAPHEPAIPAERHRNAFPDVSPPNERQRLQSLLAVDEAVAAVAKAMGDRWQSACVMALSDNGFLLDEHGSAEGKYYWWDGASRVTARIRCHGVAHPERLASTVDIAPTILAAAGVDADWPMDGRPLQETWDREGALLSAQSPDDDTFYDAIKTREWLYVEASDRPPALYRRSDGESRNWLGTDADPRGPDEWAAWLALLRNCAGSGCWIPAPHGAPERPGTPVAA